MPLIRNIINYWDTEILNIKGREKMIYVNTNHKKIGVIEFQMLSQEDGTFFHFYSPNNINSNHIKHKAKSDTA